MKPRQGSATIEAAMLCPVLILILIGLMFAAIAQYQKAVLYSIAYDAAIRMQYEHRNVHTLFTGEGGISWSEPLCGAYPNPSEEHILQMTDDVKAFVLQRWVFPLDPCSIDADIRLERSGLTKRVHVVITVHDDFPIFAFLFTHVADPYVGAAQVAVLHPYTRLHTVDMIDDMIKRHSIDDWFEQLQALFAPIAEWSVR